MLRRSAWAHAALMLALITGAAVAQPAPTTRLPRFAEFRPDAVTPPAEGRLPRKAASVATATGDRCTTFDFEGLHDSQFLPDFDDISLPGWISSIEDTHGGGGNFNNEPSPVTTVFWVFGPNFTTRDILFGSPVSSVGFSYASAFAVQLEAFDKDGNLIMTASGSANLAPPYQRYTTFTPISVSSVGDKIAKVTFHGQAQYTGMDNLTVCRHPTIDAVELTQAIQQYQQIADLKADLMNGREPPVPLIAGKPGVMRIYFEELQVTTQVKLDVAIDGAHVQRLVSVPPSCSPAKQRLRAPGCPSADFYFTPPAGDWSASVTLLDADDNTLETHALPLTSRTTEFVHLRAASVCDGKDATGNWQCEDDTVLPGLTDVLRRTAPSTSLTAGVTSSVVRLDRTRYPSDGEAWWTEMVRRVNELYTLNPAISAGTHLYYFGVVNPDRAPGGIGGIAHAIPGHASAGRSKVERLGVETNVEVVAHEIGHAFGDKHTQTNVPQASTAPPGCYNFAQDSSTDWPFADNYIQSSDRREVGFDLAFDQPLPPDTTFEMLSYCTPRWTSPQRYKNNIQALNGGVVTSPSLPAKDLLAAGTFWTVSGTISGSTLTLDPLFTRVLQGVTGAGSGTWSIVVKNGAGTPLFTRLFTPAQPHTETAGPELQGPAAFFELVPVQANAASIVVLDPSNTEVGSVSLGGTAPAVSFSAPAAGAILTGVSNVQWTIVDPDSSAFLSKLEYSPDAGATWIPLGETDQSSLRIDFDRVPGARGTALLRVLVSDGVNTGTAITAPFAVPSHGPTVAIVDNGRSHYRLGDLVWLRATAIDREDGLVDGAALQWVSSRDGPLGTGSSLAVYSLSAGAHAITVTATDSDGNRASASEQIVVASVPPTVTLSAPNAPALGARTCAELTLDAAPGQPGVPLAAVRVSLDGGQNFLEVADLSTLPFTFLAPDPPPQPPGSPAPFGAYYHVIAQAVDAAGQSDVRDLRLFVGGNCLAANVPPVANAGPDRTVTVPAGNASVLLDGSKSTDPDSTFGTSDDIVLYEWFENFALVSQTALGSGKQLPVMLSPGSHAIGLRVTDKGSLTNVAQATITVQTGLAASSTSLASSANPSVAGQSVMLTATVAGSGPGGTVTFKDGASVLCNAVPLSGGQAQCAGGALTVGAHALTAAYGGDGANASSTSSTLTQQVDKAATAVAIGTHTPSPSMPGAGVTVTATVSALAPGAGTPTGTVTVSDGSASCTITLPATGCTVTLAANGAHALAAQYGGDARFSPSVSALVAHIVGATGVLDVDASLTATQYDALTDGLLVLRYLFGLTGTSLTRGALGDTASRTDPAAIVSYLDGVKGSLDVDGNGSADALTDGLMIIRYLFGVRGNPLIAGAVAPGATRTTSAAIESYLQTLLP